MEMEARQEFTHVATPQENAYIESFHSIQERELFSRYEFLSFYDAKTHIRNYMYWYNYERKHRNLGRITPQQKWEQSPAPVNPYLYSDYLEKPQTLQIN